VSLTGKNVWQFLPKKKMHTTLPQGGTLMRFVILAQESKLLFLNEKGTFSRAKDSHVIKPKIFENKEETKAELFNAQQDGYQAYVQILDDATRNQLCMDKTQLRLTRDFFQSLGYREVPLPSNGHEALSPKELSIIILDSGFEMVFGDGKTIYDKGGTWRINYSAPGKLGFGFCLQFDSEGNFVTHGAFDVIR
jgi:hypothetical protein